MMFVAKSLSRTEEDVTLDLFKVRVGGLLAGDPCLKLVILFKYQLY